MVKIILETTTKQFLGFFCSPKLSLLLTIKDHKYVWRLLVHLYFLMIFWTWRVFFHLSTLYYIYCIVVFLNFTQIIYSLYLSCNLFHSVFLSKFIHVDHNHLTAIWYYITQLIYFPHILMCVDGHLGYFQSSPMSNKFSANILVYVFLCPWTHMYEFL